MEGNACYKYRTVKRFVDAFGAPPIKTILEVGANVGNVMVEMAECFPEACIRSYEIIPEHVETSTKKAQAYGGRLDVRFGAVTAEHLFEDDLGRKPYTEPRRLNVYLGLPEAGPGYVGGSLMAPPGINTEGSHKELPEIEVPCSTLDEVVQDMLPEGGDLDYLKTDSEGAECSFLGCASKETIKRIRYIAGEYHDFERFWPVAQKLMTTHLLNIVGGPLLGSFFCERMAMRTTLLQKTPLRPVYSKLCPDPVWWHPFDERWVLPKERKHHGLTIDCNTAYLVCGPISSGNRLMAAILKRSGCKGTAGKNQAPMDKIPPADNVPYVHVAHQDLSGWITALKNKGYSRVIAIVVVREPIANMRSAVAQQHRVPDFVRGLEARSWILAANITEIANSTANLEIITYEGLCEESLRHWLPHIGLEYKTGDLILPDQDAPVNLENQNAKHYRNV